MYPVFASKCRAYHSFMGNLLSEKKIHSTNALLVSSPSKHYTQYSASTISLLPCSQWLLSHAISPIEMYFFCLHLFMFHFCWRILSFFMLMLHFLSEFFDLILSFFCVSNRFSSPNGSFVSSICFFSCLSYFYFKSFHRGNISMIIFFRIFCFKMLFELWLFTGDATVAVSILKLYADKSYGVSYHKFLWRCLLLAIVLNFHEETMTIY